MENGGAGHTDSVGHAPWEVNAFLMLPSLDAGIIHTAAAKCFSNTSLPHDQRSLSLLQYTFGCPSAPQCYEMQGQCTLGADPHRLEH